MQESTLRSAIPPVQFGKSENMTSLSRKGGKPMDLATIVNVGGSPRDFVGGAFSSTLQSNKNIPARSIHAVEMPAVQPCLTSQAVSPRKEQVHIDYVKLAELFTHRYTRYGFSRQASALTQIIRARKDGLYLSDILPLCDVLSHIRYLLHKLATEAPQCTHEAVLSVYAEVRGRSSSSFNNMNMSASHSNLHNSSPQAESTALACSCTCCLLLDASVELLPSVQSLLELFTIPLVLNKDDMSTDPHSTSGIVNMSKLYPVLLHGMRVCFSFSTLQIPTLLPTLCNIALKQLQHYPQPLDIAYRGDHVPVLTSLSQVHVTPEYVSNNPNTVSTPPTLSYGTVLLIESNAISAFQNILDLNTERSIPSGFCSCTSLHALLVLQDPDYSPSTTSPAQCYCSSSASSVLAQVLGQSHQVQSVHPSLHASIEPLLLSPFHIDVIICTVLSTLDTLCTNVSLAGCFVYFGLFQRLLLLLCDPTVSNLNWTARQIPSTSLRLLFKIFKCHTTVFLEQATGSSQDTKSTSPLSPTQAYFLVMLRKEEAYVNVFVSIWFALAWELRSVKAKHYANTILAFLYALITPADAALVLRPLQFQQSLFSIDFVHNLQEKYHLSEDISTFLLTSAATPLHIFIAQILVTQYMFYTPSEELTNNTQNGKEFAQVVMPISTHLTIADVDAMRYSMLICVRLAQHSNVLQCISNYDVVKALLSFISLPPPLPQHLIIPKQLLGTNGELDYSTLVLPQELPVIPTDTMKLGKRYASALLRVFQTTSLIGLNQLIKILPSFASVALPQLLTFIGWALTQTQVQDQIQRMTGRTKQFQAEETTLDGETIQQLTMRENPMRTTMQKKQDEEFVEKGVSETYVLSSRVTLAMDAACTLASVLHGGIDQPTQHLAMTTLSLLLSTVMDSGSSNTGLGVTPRIVENLPLLTSIFVFSTGLLREKANTQFLLPFLDRCFPMLLVLLASPDIQSITTLHPHAATTLIDTIYMVCMRALETNDQAGTALTPEATRMMLVLPSLASTLLSVVARAPSLAFPAFTLLDYIATAYPPSLDGVRQWICPFPSATLSGSNACINLFIQTWKANVISFEAGTDSWPHSLLYNINESSLDTVLIASLAVLSGLCPSHPYNYQCFELLVPCEACVCKATPCFCQHMEVPLNIPLTQPLITMMHTLKHTQTSNMNVSSEVFLYGQITKLVGTTCLPSLAMIQHCHGKTTMCEACKKSFVRSVVLNEQAGNIALLCIHLLKKLEVIPTLPVLSTKVDGNHLLIDQAQYFRNQQLYGTTSISTQLSGTHTQQIGAMPNILNMTYNEAEEDFQNALSLSDELRQQSTSGNNLDLSMYDDLRDIRHDVPITRSSEQSSSNLASLPDPTVDSMPDEISDSTMDGMMATMQDEQTEMSTDAEDSNGFPVSLAQQAELCVLSVFHILPLLGKCRQLAFHLLSSFLSVPADQRTTTSASMLVTCSHNQATCLAYIGNIAQAQHHINELREEKHEVDAQHVYTQILLRKVQQGAKITTDRAGKKVYGQVKVKSTTKKRK